MNHTTTTRLARVSALSLLLTAGIGVAAPSTAVPLNPTLMVNLEGLADDGATLSARLQPTEIGPDAAGHLVATGRLTGTLVDPTGAGHPLDQSVTLPAEQAAGTDGCEAGDFMLGPVNLDLAGYVMHVGQSQLKTRPPTRACTAERIAG